MQVLVLDKGLVAEFGPPRELLAKGEGGVFASMVDDTGDATAKFLRGVAAGKVDLAQVCTRQVYSVQAFGFMTAAA